MINKQQEMYFLAGLLKQVVVLGIFLTTEDNKTSLIFDFIFVRRSLKINACLIFASSARL